MLALIAALTLGSGGARADSTHDRPDGPVKVVTPLKTRVVEFHGHLGPYVVLGYRLGLLARERLKSPGYFDLKAVVESPLAPPPSCFIDGVQLGSGCTVGKRNLEVKAGPIGRVLFTTRAGRSLVLSLKRDLPGRIKQWIAELGVEKAGDRCLALPAAQLFDEAPGLVPAKGATRVQP